MAQLIIGIALVAVAAVLGFYGTQLAQNGWTQVFAANQQTLRPYVVFVSVDLIIPADDSQPVQVFFDIKNTGQSEAAGFFRDFTFYFSANTEQENFAYQQSEPMSFTLAPGEQWRGRFFPSFAFTAAKLQALNAGTARLFIYAKGEYKGPGGSVFKLPFSRIYHPLVEGHLAMVPDNVSFK